MSTRGQGRFPVVMTIAAAIVFVLLCGLGVWQLQRLAWKAHLIDAIQTGLTATPVNLGDVEAGIELGYEVDWLRARATGVFRHDQERHVYILRDGKPGYEVATPLETESGLTIWVDRGFVPLEMKDPATRPQGQTEGEVEVTGLIRVHDGKPTWFFTVVNDPKKNVWMWWDLIAMSQSANPPLGGGVLPVALETQGAPPPGGYPVPWDRKSVELPNWHLGYALTWFGLALCLAGVYAAVLISRRRRSAA